MAAAASEANATAATAAAARRRGGAKEEEAAKASGAASAAGADKSSASSPPSWIPVALVALSALLGKTVAVALQHSNAGDDHDLAALCVGVRAALARDRRKRRRAVGEAQRGHAKAKHDRDPDNHAPTLLFV
jgi:hypothetical protein